MRTRQLFSFQRTLIHPLGSLALLCALVSVFLLPLPAMSAEQRPAVPAVIPPSDKGAEQRYATAKLALSRLEQDQHLGKDRNNWLKVAQSFQSIHQTQKKASLGPPSLFMLAKTYRRMHELFQQPADLEEAATNYQKVADLYPAHTLADDALFGAGECIFRMPGKEEAALVLFQKIVDLYPQGDFAAKAKGRLKKKEEPPAPPSATILPLATPALPATTHPGLALLSPVKYWVSENYARIVLQTTGPVTFSSGKGEGEGTANQLYVDIQRAQLPKLRTPLTAPEGLLRQINLVPSGPEAVRAVIDLNGFSEYTIFSLHDPFRIIVDVHGAPAGKPVAPGPTTSSTSATPTPSPSAPTVASGVSAPTIKPGQTPGSNSPPIPESFNLEEQKKRSPKAELPVKATQQEKLSLAQQLGLGVRKIVIDPGHGGKDPGAMAFGLKEKDITLSVAKKISKILKTTHHYEAVLTRTKDEYISLEERTAIANTQKSDLFVSIHVNAHADKASSGVETYFLNLATDAHAMRVAALENATSTHSIGELQDILKSLMKNSKIDESSRLAQFVQTNLIAGLVKKHKTRDLGVKQAPFYVLIGAEMPAILAEIAFITNPEEARLLQNEQYQQQLAEQIAAGIVAYIAHHHTAAVKF